MARQLPLDVFISRKIEKWTQRAKSRNCDFVDAIGVSPLVESAYFWAGPKRMAEPQLLTALSALEWSEKHDPYWKDEQVDERAILGLLRAACLRNLGRTGNLGRIDEAKRVLAGQVFCYTLQQIKTCEHADNWSLPVAHYEHAVCFWDEAGGQDGDRDLLKQCSSELVKIEKWESFDMDARVGLKLTTARESLRRSGIV